MKTNFLLTAALSLSFCAASTAQTLPSYLPTDGLVGWWPFNGNANDESGNGNNGLVNGATLTEDRFGVANKAYSFDGVDDWIESDVDYNKNFSLSYWINSGPYKGYNGQVGASVVSSLINGPSWPNNWEAHFGFFNSTHGFGNGEVGVTAEDVLQNSWYNIVCTYDSSSTTMKVYKNGVPIDTSNSFTYNKTSSKIVFGGRANNPVNLLFEGKLDDIAIYNRALTPEEITALYTGEPVNPPAACNPLPANLQNGLVGYWPFCGNANDESGNGNDGTVNGATLTQDRFGVANAAYDFDGVDDYIDCGNNSELNLTNFTLAVWYKLNNLPLSVTDENVLVVKSDYNSGTLGYRIAISTEPQNADYFIWSQMGGGNSCGDYTNTNDAPSILEWTHIVAIKDEGTIKIFKNGIEENSKSGLCGNFNNERPLLFGCKYDYILVDILNGFFDGSLDDIGIWNRALTPDEVQQLYTLNACTFTIYDTVTVTETIYDTVSVSVSTTDTLIINTLITTIEPAQENTFLVYPNPASTQITINNGNVAILGGYTMRISNSLGQDVYNQTITQPEVTLDLSTWGGNGLYVLYIVDPQQNIVAVKQIVLQ